MPKPPALLSGWRSSRPTWVLAPGLLGCVLTFRQRRCARGQARPRVESHRVRPRGLWKAKDSCRGSTAGPQLKGARGWGDREQWHPGGEGRLAVGERRRSCTKRAGNRSRSYWCGLWALGEANRRPFNTLSHVLSQGHVLSLRGKRTSCHGKMPGPSVIGGKAEHTLLRDKGRTSSNLTWGLGPDSQQGPSGTREQGPKTEFGVHGALPDPLLPLQSSAGPPPARTAA